MPLLHKASSALDYARAVSLKWLPSHRIELPSYVPLTSFPAHLKPPTASPLRSLFGNCLYRRLLLWLAAALCALLVLLLTVTHGRLGLFHKHKPPAESKPPSAESVWVNYTRCVSLSLSLSPSSVLPFSTKD